MESLIKACYKEAGILGANPLIIEKRSRAIQTILDNEHMDDDKADMISSWLMGGEMEEIEDILIEIEKIFCEEDASFSEEDEREIKVLCSIILLEYCKQNENISTSLIILCGKELEIKLLCPSLYIQFQKLIVDFRIGFRKCINDEYEINETKINELRQKISDDSTESEEQEYSELREQLEDLVEIVEVQDQNIDILKKINENLKNMIVCQREESDVLWWMLNKWSSNYKKAFSDMKKEELAIAIPLELYRYSQFELLPYSTERIINSIIKECENSSEKVLLADYMKNINEDIIDSLEIDENCIKIIQPILAIIYCMKECGTEEDAWKGMLKKKYSCNIENIWLTPFEFARHFCLELELMKHLKD